MMVLPCIGKQHDFRKLLLSGYTLYWHCHILLIALFNKSATTMKGTVLLISICFTSLAFSQNRTAGVNCDSLNTLYAYTYLNHGAMFDVVARQDNVTLDHLNANIKNGTIVYYIYYKTGSFYGFETQPLAWTLIDSVSVTSNNTLVINNEPTVIPINLNLNLNQGDTVALYLEALNLSKVYLTSTTEPWGNAYVSDTAISISIARSIYQSFGVPFSTPQVWNGTVSYCLPGSVGVNDKFAEEAITIFQSSDQLNIELPGEILNNSRNLELSIVDLLARSVAKYSVNSSNFTVDTRALSHGLYVCSLADQSGVLKQQKIVIR